MTNRKAGLIRICEFFWFAIAVVIWVIGPFWLAAGWLLVGLGLLWRFGEPKRWSESTPLRGRKFSWWMWLLQIAPLMVGFMQFLGNRHIFPVLLSVAISEGIFFVANSAVSKGSLQGSFGRIDFEATPAAFWVAISVLLLAGSGIMFLPWIVEL